MAMFSEGGISSPDIWIVLTMNVAAFISITLNPLVFKHNVLKQRSLARDLYLALSSTDFISSVALSIRYSRKILEPKEESCTKDEGLQFCKNHYIEYARPATDREKAFGSMFWFLMLIPLIVTSVLAICRWYQTRYPLRPSRKTLVEVGAAILCLLTGGYYTWSIFSDTPEKPTMMVVRIQNVWNGAQIQGRKREIPAEIILTILVIFLSTVASVLTIWNVVAVDKTIRRCSGGGGRRMRSAVKIAMLNAGDIVLVALLTGSLLLSDSLNILHTVSVCFAPIVLSAFNPVIYIALTRGVVNFHVRRN